MRWMGQEKAMPEIRSKLLMTSLAMLSTVLICGFAQGEPLPASQTVRPAKAVTSPGHRVVRRIAANSKRPTAQPMAVECRWWIGCRHYLILGVAY
jgi:hypothetical protein